MGSVVLGKREGSRRRAKSRAIAGLLLLHRQWYSDISESSGSVVLLPVFKKCLHLSSCDVGHATHFSSLNWGHQVRIYLIGLL